MKISAKVREEAAVLCLIAVSEQTGLNEAAMRVYAFDALDLAISARFSVELEQTRQHRICIPYLDSCIEAAALLRDGWNPGDPIVPWVPR